MMSTGMRFDRCSFAPPVTAFPSLILGMLLFLAACVNRIVLSPVSRLRTQWVGVMHLLFLCRSLLVSICRLQIPYVLHVTPIVKFRLSWLSSHSPNDEGCGENIKRWEGQLVSLPGQNLSSATCGKSLFSALTKTRQGQAIKFYGLILEWCL